MSDNAYFEEEEFATRFSGTTFRRILGLLKPHWKWVTGFLVTIALVSAMDSLFTFLTKQVFDLAIVPKDLGMLRKIVIQYGVLLLIQAALVFLFIYLVALLGERIRYDLRQKMFNHQQDLSLSYYSRTPVGWIRPRNLPSGETPAE